MLSQLSYSLLSELLLTKAKDFPLICNCTIEGSLFILEEMSACFGICTIYLQIGVYDEDFF